MFKSDILFWNVDTQFDFMNRQGKLYVPGAEAIFANLQTVTDFAEDQNIQVVNTADYHFSNSKELSDTPDFIHTFPQHCMADSKGAEFAAETAPKNAANLPWDTIFSDKDLKETARHRNIIIRKDAFDVFSGNKNTERLLHIIAPKTVFIYGVTTNVCVHFAVMGLAERGISVFVLEDTIKELPNIPIPFEQWDNAGVKRITLDAMIKFVK